jgi:hypothetical protein
MSVTVLMTVLGHQQTDGQQHVRCAKHASYIITEGTDNDANVAVCIQTSAILSQPQAPLLVFLQLNTATSNTLTKVMLSIFPADTT